MENMDKIQELESELQALKNKVSNLEEDLRKAEVRIQTMSTSQTTTSSYTYSKPATGVPNGYMQPVSAPNAASTGTVQNPYWNRPAQNPYVNNTAQNTYVNSATRNPYVNNSAQNPYVNYKAPQNMQQRVPVNNLSTESWVGKILMGALASLLIFIAFITFAKLLLPYITDTVKIILMFVASIALTAAGYVLSKKKPENTFFKALLGCGCACIYLSIMVTGIHFKAISLIVMYVLLALWAGLMIVFANGKSDWLFFAIGNLGYFVSVMFTAGLKDIKLVLPMLIYIVVVGVVYQIMYWKNESQRDLQCIINVFSLLIYELVVSVKFNDAVEVCITAAVAIIWASAGFLIYMLSDLFKYKKNNFYFASIYAFAYLVAYFVLSGLLDFPVIMTFCAIIIPAVVFEVISAYWRINNLTKDEVTVSAVFSGFLFTVAAVFLERDKNIIFTSGIIMILYASLIIYGLFRKDSFFKLKGWILLAICMFMGYEADAGIVFFAVAAVLSVVSLIIEGYVLNDSSLFKLVSYGFLLFTIIRIGFMTSDFPAFAGKEDEVCLVTYGIMSLLNLIFILAGFYKTNEKDNGKNCHIVLDILNVMYMLAGMWFMAMVDGDLFKAIYMVIVFALACINIPVKENGSRYRYLYSGIKLGIIIFYSISTFRAPEPVISMCMIAFAVLCIAIGFKNRLLTKELRIFGLMTTLLFVIKFVVFDISFDSSVMKALSYLISGILCFGISAIYNHFEKRAGNDNSGQGQNYQN
ncbi:MAG: hypothetical protein J5802_08925 [Butyrivibrio sp.]|nr:hypothetical protein [Butyrivibrio sp.]